jgi:hypothetical protein
MNKIILLMLLIFVSSQVHAGVTCTGVIRDVNNYSTSENLYILLDNTSHYIGLEKKTAISMALTAFASGKKVTFHMVGTFTNCSGGPTNASWDNTEILNGWIRIDK